MYAKVLDLTVVEIDANKQFLSWVRLEWYCWTRRLSLFVKVSMFVGCERCES